MTLPIPLNPKRAGGTESAPFDIFCYISAGCYLFALKLLDFFFKPCARFKTIFIKIGPRVMTRLCVIARWVQRKTDFPLKLHTNRVFVLFVCLFVFFFFLSFLSFRIHFHYVLSYLFGLFGVRTCVSILWHTLLLKMQVLLEKVTKNDNFGDFWWFSCFWHDVFYDVTVTSYKVCFEFFGTNGLGRVIAIH